MTTYSAHSQGVDKNQTLSLKCDENELWLSNLTEKNKFDQWSAIVERYFKFRPYSIEYDSAGRLCIPTLVIDGIPLLIKYNLSEQSKLELYQLLTYDKIKNILIVDKEPEGLYINKAFSGWIVVTLSDKKASKKLQKIKLE